MRRRPQPPYQPPHPGPQPVSAHGLYAAVADVIAPVVVAACVAPKEGPKSTALRIDCCVSVAAVREAAHWLLYVGYGKRCSSLRSGAGAAGAAGDWCLAVGGKR